MKKISVIIPMYNAENFIEQCLQSVICQTYKNLEILVIDDGSADKSYEICERMKALDGRIQVLRQEKGGVSAARNRGIEEAAGEYVFFLDSDDAIHPCLLEEMLEQAESRRVQLVFCSYRRLESRQMETVLKEVWKFSESEGNTDCRKPLNQDSQVQWLMADEEGTKKWFHVKYTDILSGIGGKLILREAIGNMRFDRELTNGEDTFFLYQLVKEEVKSVYCLEEWYYYRTHGESVTNSVGTAGGKRYFESAMRIRDGEYESGHGDYAMRWEILVVNQIRRKYAALRDRKEKDAVSELKKIAKKERVHPLFTRVCFSDRVLFTCCFSCHPLYIILNALAIKLAKTA